MAGNKITRNDIVEEKVLSIGTDYAKSLQAAIDANEKWLQSFKPIKEAALAQANIASQFKVAQGQKEFLQIKKLQEEAIIKSNKALESEQRLLVSKQKTEQAIIDTEKKSIALTNQKVKTQEKSIKLTAQEKLELSILNRGKREAAVISSKLSTEYERQSKILIQLRRRYKDAALTQGESSDAAKKLADRIRILDARLKRVDANVGQFQRSVGNYGKAMNSARSAARGLASALGLVGGAFLVVQVARDAIKVIKDFEKGNATLSAILQVTKEDMSALSDEAIRLGSITVKTAGEVTQLQIAYARLGFSQQEILDLTESTINGSIAMNAELDRTASLTGAIVNTFDDLGTSDAPKILDILSLATAKSALNFEKLEKGIPIVAAAANAAGVPFTKLIALLGKLSDSGIDVSSSSTALRNIFIESAAQGLNYSEILQKIKDSQDKLTAANDEFGKRAAVSATVLAANIDAVDELDESLNKAAGTAERMANKELDTLDGALKLLRSAWEGYIIGVNESGQSSDKFKKIIKSLADNLDKIFGVIITATKAWVAYKAITLLAGIQQKVLAASIVSSNRALVINRLASIRAAQGLNLTSTASIKAAIAFKRFNAALKANAIFLAVGAIVGLVAIFKKLNKSIIDTANELHEANEEFIEQTMSTINLNAALGKAADRYDELKNKSELSKDEQKELDDIIKLIAKHVPEAVTEIDKYGTALSINTGLVKDFNKENGKIAELQADINIKNQTKALNELKKEQEQFNQVFETGNKTYVTGFGTIKKLGAEYFRLKTNISASGAVTVSEIKLSKEQKLAYLERQKAVEDAIETTKKDIEANEDIIASITGVKNARQEDAEVAEVLVKQKQDEIAVVKVLKGEISELENQLKLLTKNGYENLNQAQIDLIKSTRSILSEKKKELNSILGITKANKDADKAAKERAKAEKKLRDDASKLQSFVLKQKIKEQKAIAKNDKESFDDRKTALENQALFEVELAKLDAENKLQNIKGFNEEEIDVLLSKNKLTLEETKNLTDQQLLIFREFQSKKNDIQIGKESGEDSLDVERLKSEAETQKAIKEKQLNEELRLENEAFLKREGIYADVEDATEERERRIAEIKKRYALEALDDQVKAIESLLKTEELSAEERAKIEARLAAIKLEISDINTEKWIENNDDVVKSEFEKTERILQLSAELASALTDLTNSIFDAKIQKIDEEIEASDDKYEKLLENDLLTEEQRKGIEESQEADRKKLEKKKKEEQRKQAVLNKISTAFNIALQTSLAVISTLAQVPKFDFGISATALAAVVAGIGAVQLAAALAQPIPSYAKGTDNHPGGKALVGEQRPEVIHEPNKAPYIISKPTVIDLPKHTKVTPSLDEYKRLMKASILASVDIDNKKLNTFQANVSVNNNYDLLVKEMQLTREAFKNQKRPIVNIHEKNIDINHAIWAAKNIKWNG